MWGIELERKGEMTLSRQIFNTLRDQMIEGVLAEGEALPSTRALSKGLDVSRNTVSEAYDMLWTEGFIVRQQGAASRVSSGLKMERHVIEVSSDGEAPKVNKASKPPEASKDGANETKSPMQWYFKTGRPDLKHFPWRQWRQMLHEAVESVTGAEMMYSGPKGYEPLCAAIAKWLLRSRNMYVDPADVFITSGSTQAFYMLVEILRKPEFAFGLENPSHPAIRTAVQDKGDLVHWMSVTEEGMDLSGLSDMPLAAVYTTPSHQFPLGGILKASTRAELIRLAKMRDFYIIEDDYDSEYRYIGPPISPMYTLDKQRVIYVGTFSKTLFPALRIGFAIIPKPLQAKWRHCRNYMDVQNPTFEQMALTAFIESRKMDKHIRKMCRLYHGKRDVLMAAIDTHFEAEVQPWGDASGLHLALQFKNRRFNAEFFKACRAHGIYVQSVQQYCTEAVRHDDKLLLGYGHLQKENIIEGIAALNKIIRQCP